MDCHEAIDLLGPFTDDELKPAERELIERHLAGCASCRRELGMLERLSSTVRRVGGFPLPDGLADRVRARLASEERQTSSAPSRLRSLSWLPRQPLALAASHIGALVLGGMLVLGSGVLQPDRTPAADTILTAHVRSLMAEQFPAVASTDQHTVKPWFQGKLDYSPVVVDLAAQGFPLVDGRVDYIAGRPVAALGYTRGKHKISVYVLPAGILPAPTPMSAAERGYTVLAWQKAGFDFWIVSDVNPPDLHTFSDELQAQAAAAAAGGEP